MTTIHHSPPPGTAPFAIYHDSGDLDEPPSPSEVYDGEGESFQSAVELAAVDDAIPSIEVFSHAQSNEQTEEEQPRPYSSSYTALPSILSTSTRSRRISGVTTTSFVSSLPSEISVASKPQLPPANNHGIDGAGKYTPRKERPLFRNPASVRAMQMSSPPPFATSTFTSPHEQRMKGAYKLATPSRSGRSDTPSSSRRSLGSHSRGMGQHHTGEQLHVQRERSPRPKTPTPQPPQPQNQLPLVLLHVTILPMQIPYSHDLMLKTMPEWLVKNYKLLDEKLHDVVLMRRGLLIPHPNDEYDLLEERILESLELKEPRLLKCGHFVREDSDDDEDDDGGDSSFLSNDEEEEADDGRETSMSGGTITVEEDAGECAECRDANVCTDCHRPVRKPGKGVGAGSKRWDIKIYAANGLMRAGAWAAAWREMERCDVEISPWIPEEVKLDLEKRAEEEQEAERQKMLYDAELTRLAEEDAAREQRQEVEKKEKSQFEEELWKTIEAERERKAEEDKAMKIMFDATLNVKIEEVKEAIRLEFETQALVESDIVTERFRTLEEKLRAAELAAVPPAPPVPDPPAAAINEHTRQRSRSRPRSSSSRHHQHDQIALGTALRNYLVLLACDQKNIAIVIMGALVAFLAVQANAGQRLALQSLLPSVSHPSVPAPPVSISSVVVVTDTATATLTTTEVAYTTVTHVAYHTVEVPMPVPSVEVSDAELASVVEMAESAESERLAAAEVEEKSSVAVPSLEVLAVQEPEAASSSREPSIVDVSSIIPTPSASQAAPKPPKSAAPDAPLAETVEEQTATLTDFDSADADEAVFITSDSMTYEDIDESAAPIELITVLDEAFDMSSQEEEEVEEAVLEAWETSTDEDSAIQTEERDISSSESGATMPESEVSVHIDSSNEHEADVSTSHTSPNETAPQHLFGKSDSRTCNTGLPGQPLEPAEDDVGICLKSVYDPFSDEIRSIDDWNMEETA